MWLLQVMYGDVGKAQWIGWGWPGDEEAMMGVLNVEVIP